MRQEVATSAHRLDGLIEYVDQPAAIFAVGIAAHGRFVDGDDLAARIGESRELLSHDRNERLRDRVTVPVAIIRLEPASEGVWSGHAGLESRAFRSQALETLELNHHPKTGGP